jgi:hypothetical protein
VPKEPSRCNYVAVAVFINNFLKAKVSKHLRQVGKRGKKEKTVIKQKKSKRRRVKEEERVRVMERQKEKKKDRIS